MLGLNSIYSNNKYIIDAPIIINISLVKTITRTQGGILKWRGAVFVKVRVIKATANRNLSARGSRAVPRWVICLYRLAINPSIASVITAVRKTMRGRLAKSRWSSR
jgi:hypothetical protein